MDTLHKTTTILTALMMGMNVQMQGYDVYMGYTEDSDCLSFRTNEGKLFALCLTVDGFLKWCRSVPEKDIVALTMDIALNKEKNKNAVERKTAGDIL